MTVLDLTNNRASSFRPDERLCSSVMLRDERADCALEFTHRTEPNVPRRMRFAVISEKNRSTAFSQDELVGVK